MNARLRGKDALVRCYLVLVSCFWGSARLVGVEGTGRGQGRAVGLGGGLWQEAKDWAIECGRAFPQHQLCHHQRDSCSTPNRFSLCMHYKPLSPGSISK